MKRYLLLAAACSLGGIVVPAFGAENYVLELPEAETKQIEVIGTVPPKRYIELDLGDLRTREARLPGGFYSSEERGLMRARRALERQRAVTDARRREPSVSMNVQMGSPTPAVSRPVVNRAPPQMPGATIEIQ